MNEQNAGEARQAELGRVEAFSDAVVAIIVTVMVLEFKVPEDPDLAALLRLQPQFYAYVLSFIYVGIYWVNHHRLFTHARRVTNGLLWSNLALLFALSLTPFASAYLGEHHFRASAVTLYLAVLALPAFAYSFVQNSIERQLGAGIAANAYLNATRRKGYWSTAIYLIGIGLSFISAGLALACAVIVAIFWLVPETPVDRLFRRERNDGANMGDKVN